MAVCPKEAIDAFVNNACVGSQIVYYAANNSNGYQGLDVALKQPMRPLIYVVNRVRQLYNAGLIDLVQDRSERWKTKYVAIWRQNPALIIDGLGLPLIGVK